MDKQQASAIKVGDRVRDLYSGVYTVTAIKVRGIEAPHFRLSGTGLHGDGKLTSYRLLRMLP